MLRILKRHLDERKRDIEKYRKLQLAAVSKFADDKIAELTRRLAFFCCREFDWNL